MNAAPLLSIVIPIHGRQEMVEDLLRSIPKLHEIEVLLVDDHTDPEIFLPDGSISDGVNLSRLPEGKRYAGTARNYGIERARGDFIMFVDSDDLVSEEGLISALPQLSNDYDIFYVQGDSFREDEGPGSRHLSPNFVIKEFARTGFWQPLVTLHQPMFKIYSKEFLIEGEFRFDGTRHANDVMFNARCIAGSPRCAFLDVVIPLIREGNGSLTNTVNVESVNLRLEVQEAYNDFLRMHGLCEYRIPLINQLKKILSMDPILSAKWVLRFVRKRHPILVTSHFLRQKIRMKFGK